MVYKIAVAVGVVCADFSQMKITGTCENLEKMYLRLTMAPDPSTVRPERVLKQTLAMLEKKWREAPDYKYTCDQFKSLRQDLTVQHIKNRFAADVYEAHARIALQAVRSRTAVLSLPFIHSVSVASQLDLSEYNQCQTQLKVRHIVDKCYQRAVSLTQWNLPGLVSRFSGLASQSPRVHLVSVSETL